MRLFKKQKREEGTRRVFGFLCTPKIADDVRAVSQELSLDIYAVGEHCLETGLCQVLADMKSEDTRSSLHEHILESHFLRPLFDIGNRYDEETSVRLRRWQLRRWELDRIAHELVSIVNQEGVPPNLLIEITKSLIEDVRSRRIYRNRRQGGISYEEHQDT